MEAIESQAGGEEEDLLELLLAHAEVPEWYRELEERCRRTAGLSEQECALDSLQVSEFFRFDAHQTEVARAAIDAIRGDWATDIGALASPAGAGGGGGDSVSELWKLPAALILKPRHWREKPSEIYINFAYYVAEPGDRLPERYSIPERKKYQRIDYLAELLRQQQQQQLQASAGAAAQPAKLEPRKAKPAAKTSHMPIAANDEVVKLLAVKHYVASDKAKLGLSMRSRFAGKKSSAANLFLKKHQSLKF